MLGAPVGSLDASSSSSGPGWKGRSEVLVEGGAHRFALTAAAVNTLLSCWVASHDPADKTWADAVLEGLAHG
jgi:hypothetical protein